MSGATSKLTVRPAVPGDLAAIMGIYNWAVNQTFATLDAEPLVTLVHREEMVDDFLFAH